MMFACFRFQDTLKERSFTFWEWFYAVLKLTKEHLKGPWTDGSVRAQGLGFCVSSVFFFVTCVTGTDLNRTRPRARVCRISTEGS